MNTGRAAGAGLWSAYVRSAMLHNAPSTVDMFDTRHTSILADLDEIKPLSKEEKNSLTSAKCIIKGCVERAVDVWKRTDTGAIETDDAGHPLPRGKSDLQNDKSMFEMLMKAATGMTKRMGADDAEPLSAEQRTLLAAAIMDVMLAAGITSA